MLLPVQAEPVGARSRAVASSMLTLRNSGYDPATLILESDLPEGWKAVSPRSEVSLGPGTSDLRLLSFFVPSETRAGRYSVRCRLVDPGTMKTAAECEVKVDVLPEYSIEFRLLEKPQFVVAGQEYDIVTVLSNTGNTDLLVRLKVEGGASYRYRFRDLPGVDEVLLPVGAVQTITLVGGTNEALRRFETQRVQVKAMLGSLDPSQPPRTEPLGFISYAVEVVPLSLDNREIIYTLPVDLLTTAEGRFGQYTSGYLAEQVQAKGSIDENGLHHVNLNLTRRLASDSDSVWFDAQDRYLLKYDSRWGEAWLGDESYSLSPLLGGSGVARGARVLAPLLPVRIEAMYYDNVWSAADDRGAGAAVDYTVPGAGGWKDFLYRGRLSLLSTLDGYLSYGLSNAIRPIPGIEGVLDLALQNDPAGDLSMALYATAEGSHDLFSWSGSLIRSGPEFVGQYRDVLAGQAQVDLALKEYGIDLRAMFNLTDSNLDLDQSLSSADRTVQFAGGVKADIPTLDTEISVDWQNFHRVDRFPAPSYDSSSNVFKLGLMWESATMEAGISTRLEFGRNTLDGSTFLSHDESLSFGWTPSEEWKHSALARLVGRSRSDGSSEIIPGLTWQTGYGANGLDISGGFNASFGFTESGWTDTSVGISAKLSREFMNHHVLAVLADISLNGSQDGWTQNYTLTASYRVPLDVPIGRRSSTAIVKGRVYNALTGVGMPGILIRMNGLVTMTGPSGDYSFYLPRLQSTFFYLDRSTVPSDMVTLVTMPMGISTLDDPDQVFDVGLVVSCSLKGSVGLYELVTGDSLQASQADGQAAEHVREGGLANLVVELSDGTWVARRLTDQNGAFSFHDLRPGTYTLRIVGGAIPSYHTIDPEAMELTLLPRDEKEVEIRVVEERRNIQIQMDLGSLVLEMPSSVMSESTIVQESPEPPKEQEPIETRSSITPANEGTGSEVILEGDYESAAPRMVPAPPMASSGSPSGNGDGGVVEVTHASQETPMSPENPAQQEGPAPPEAIPDTPTGGEDGNVVAELPGEPPEPDETLSNGSAPEPSENPPLPDSIAMLPMPDETGIIDRLGPEYDPDVHGAVAHEPAAELAEASPDATPESTVPETTGPSESLPAETIPRLAEGSELQGTIGAPPLPDKAGSVVRPGPVHGVNPPAASQTELVDEVRDPPAGTRVRLVEPEPLKGGFGKAISRFGQWVLGERTIRQTDPSMFFAKAQVPVVQELTPMRFTFEARSTGEYWVGFGIHLYVTGSVYSDGYGCGDSLLVWLTYDPLHLKTRKSVIQVYRSYSDTRMELLAESSVEADVFSLNQFEIEVDPVKGYLRIRINGDEVLEAEGITDLRASDRIIFRTIDTAEFLSFRVEQLPTGILSPIALR